MRVFPRTASLTAAGANTTGTPVNVAGLEAASCQVTGTFTADVEFKASVDGVTYFDIYGHNVGDANHSYAKKVTAAAMIQFRDLAGIQFLRADVANWSVGTVTAAFAGLG